MKTLVSSPRLAALAALLAAGCSSGLIGSWSGSASAQTPEIAIESRPTITITGHGEASQVPDTAYVMIGVETQGVQAGEALRENNRSMEKLFDTLERRDISERDIQTTNFSISPQYRNDQPRRGSEPSEPKIVGYRIRNQVRVKVKELDILGPLLDEIVTEGANSISGINFDVDDPQEAEDQARRAAVKDAFRKAQLYADAVDGTVGKALRVTESFGRPSPMPMMGRAMAMSAESSVPVARGEQQLSADVTIIYELNSR